MIYGTEDGENYEMQISNNGRRSFEMTISRPLQQVSLDFNVFGKIAIVSHVEGQGCHLYKYNAKTRRVGRRVRGPRSTLLFIKYQTSPEKSTKPKS